MKKIKIAVLGRGIDWQNLTDEDGKELVFDIENAKKLISEHPNKNKTKFGLTCQDGRYVVPGWIV